MTMMVNIIKAHGPFKAHASFTLDYDFLLLLWHLAFWKMILMVPVNVCRRF